MIDENPIRVKHTKQQMIEKKKLDSRREQKNYLNTVDKCSSGAMTNWGACSYFDREREKYFGRD